MTQTIDQDDPLAFIRARYERHERLPIPKFVDAVRGAGCTTAPSRMRGVNYEVNYGGMCVGTITVDNGVPVLEMSKRETPAGVLRSVSGNVERMKANAMRQEQGVSLGIA